MQGQWIGVQGLGGVSDLRRDVGRDAVSGKVSGGWKRVQQVWVTWDWGVAEGEQKVGGGRE